MMKRSCKVISALQGRTIATAESCTGGSIGAALTAVSGSSEVYKGGIISYCNEIKISQLSVKEDTLKRFGAVSAQTAEEMALGVRSRLDTDMAVSVTGLAGPNGDGSDKPVGTVYIGYCDEQKVRVEEFHFSGNREEVRQQAIVAALDIILEEC